MHGMPAGKVSEGGRKQEKTKRQGVDRLTEKKEKH